jgi:hypothetical protein
MPDETEHLDQQNQNLRLFRDLKKNNQNYYDWWIVLVFYASVHDIEMYLSRKQIHCKSHSDRKRKISADVNLSQIRVDYDTALSISRGARYDCVADTIQDFQDFFRTYETIRDHIAALP